jgi:hypothetical protein
MRLQSYFWAANLLFVPDLVKVIDFNTQAHLF